MPLLRSNVAPPVLAVLRVLLVSCSVSPSNNCNELIVTCCSNRQKTNDEDMLWDPTFVICSNAICMKVIVSSCSRTLENGGAVAYDSAGWTQAFA